MIPFRAAVLRSGIAGVTQIAGGRVLHATISGGNRESDNWRLTKRTAIVSRCLPHLQVYCRTRMRCVRAGGCGAGATRRSDTAG